MLGAGGRDRRSLADLASVSDPAAADPSTSKGVDTARVDTDSTLQAAVEAESVALGEDGRSCCVSPALSPWSG